MIRMELTWIRQWDNTDDIVSWVDVAKLDRAWRADGAYYIAAEKATTADRCQKFGRWIKLGRPIWMPRVAINEGIISFTDGRHRFAWLRDHMVKALPVTTEGGSAQYIESELGTKSRRSIIG